MQDHLSTVADKNCQLVCFTFIFFPYFLSWTFSSYEYIARINTKQTASVRSQSFICCYTAITGGNVIIVIEARRALSLWQKSKYDVIAYERNEDINAIKLFVEQPKDK